MYLHVNHTTNPEAPPFPANRCIFPMRLLMSINSFAHESPTYLGRIMLMLRLLLLLLLLLPPSCAVLFVLHNELSLALPPTRVVGEDLPFPARKPRQAPFQVGASPSERWSRASSATNDQWM